MQPMVRCRLHGRPGRSSRLPPGQHSRNDNRVWYNLPIHRRPAVPTRPVSQRAAGRVSSQLLQLRGELLSRIVLPLVCILLVHLAAVMDRPDLCLFVFLAASAASAVSVWLLRGPWLLVAAYLAIAIVFTVLISLHFAGYSKWSYAIFVPPVIINLGLSIIFGATLTPGRTPLVTHFAELHHDGDFSRPAETLYAPPDVSVVSASRRHGGRGGGPGGDRRSGHVVVDRQHCQSIDIG